MVDITKRTADGGILRDWNAMRRCKGCRRVFKAKHQDERHCPECRKPEPGPA